MEPTKKKPRIMHHTHMEPSAKEELVAVYNTQGYDAAFNWLRDRHYMSVNQTNAFLKDAGLTEK